MSNLNQTIMKLSLLINDMCKYCYRERDIRIGSGTHRKIRWSIWSQLISFCAHCPI